MGEFPSREHQFKPGNPGGPGRPKRRRIHGALADFFDKSPEKAELLVQAWFEKACEDPAFAKLLAEHIDGPWPKDEGSKGGNVVVLGGFELKDRRKKKKGDGK